MSTRPSFDDLPLRKDGPRGNAWGLFGDNDQIGALNFLTEETTKEAVKEIVHGVRVSTDWPLDAMTKPAFGRPPFKHTIDTVAGHAIHDDSVSFNTQCSSQWDGFRHYGYQKEKIYYNGVTLKQLEESTVNGVDAWVTKGGIVGRGVLLDYAAWTESQGIESKVFETTSIHVSTLEKVAAHQGTSFKQGDILFIRTGWVRGYNNFSDTQRQALAESSNPPCIGVESSEETLRWLWDNGFAAAAGDHQALEAWPCQDEEFFLHEWLLAGWGMPIGELFDLERLSEECKRLKKWSFFFSSVPLKIPGGVASPPNGVAIL